MAISPSATISVLPSIVSSVQLSCSNLRHSIVVPGTEVSALSVLGKDGSVGAPSSLFMDDLANLLAKYTEEACMGLDSDSVL